MALLGYMMEPEDCTYVNGSWSLSTDGWATDATRGRLRGAFYGSGSESNTYLVKTFPTTKTTCCICGKWPFFSPAGTTTIYPFLGFASGNQRILAIAGIQTNSLNYVTFRKWNPSNSTWTTLGTSAVALSGDSSRFEVMIENHGQNAHVRVWRRTMSSYQLNYSSPHTLILDLDPVDTRVTGFDNIDGFWGAGLRYGTQLMCSFIAADEPTHRYEVFPHNITGAGDVNDMATGTYASIDELNADTSDFVEGASGGQHILCAGASMPTFALSVVGVQVSALASCGVSGPTGVQLGIKSGSEDWGPTFLPGAGWTNVSRLMTVNPVTGNPFTVSEVNAMQYGVKAIA